MVSVFLRVLEYYSGILFLTTNRVATFDEAFKSRIHIPIRYTDLDVTSRLQIWRNFCGKVPGGVEITDAEYEKLAECDFNGRQIKNGSYSPPPPKNPQPIASEQPRPCQEIIHP